LPKTQPLTGIVICEKKMDVSYTDYLDGLTADQLQGFFVDWPTYPDAEAHLRILAGSYGAFSLLYSEAGVTPPSAPSGAAGLWWLALRSYASLA